MAEDTKETLTQEAEAVEAKAGQVVEQAGAEVDAAKQAVTESAEQAKATAKAGAGLAAEGAKAGGNLVQRGARSVKESFMHCYFGFDGRLSRGSYVVRFVSIWVTFMVITGLFMYAFGVSSVTDAGSGGGHFMYSVFQKIWVVLVGISGITLNTRRLHDLNHTGWWQILFVMPTVIAIAAVITVIVGIALGVSGGSHATITGVMGISGLLAAGLCWLVTIIFQIYLIIKRGTVGANKYGDDPLAEDDARPITDREV